MKRLCLSHSVAMIVSAIITVSAMAAPPEGDAKTMRLTIMPAVPTEPLLEHRFVFTLPEQTSGNAVVKYGKVFAEQQAFARYDAYWLNEDRLRKLPLDQLARNDVAQSVAFYTSIIANIHAGAICEDCDWQLPIRHQPFYDILLPELQQARAFGRILLLRARVQIANNDLEGAISTMRDGFTLARHVANAPTFVNSLAGMAMVRDLCDVAMELQQQPGAPNLIWAFTAMPEPFIDFRRGVEGSLSGFELTFDFVQHLDSDDFTKDYWNSQLRQVWDLMSGESSSFNESLGSLETWSLHAYPLAKQRLTVSGMSTETVEAMPVAKVILMQSYREYQRQLQHRYRWTFLPYREAKRHLEDEQELVENSGDVLPLEQAFPLDFELILRTDYSTRSHLSLLKNIEAIRWHAAVNEGKLPQTLDEITVIDVARDPLTGERFPYELNGDTATLTTAWLTDKPTRFELSVAQPAQEDTP